MGRTESSLEKSEEAAYAADWYAANVARNQSHTHDQQVCNLIAKSLILKYFCYSFQINLYFSSGKNLFGGSKSIILSATVYYSF